MKLLLRVAVKKTKTWAMEWGKMAVIIITLIDLIMTRNRKGMAYKCLSSKINVINSRLYFREVDIRCCWKIG